MPGPCEIKLEDLQSEPPYLAGGLPERIRVVGRTSDNCDTVDVSVSTAPGATPIFQTQVTVSFDPTAAPLPGLFVVTFIPPFVLNLACGGQLWVEASCATDPNCRDSGLRTIACKPPPDTGSGGTPGTPGTDGSDDDGGSSSTWPWPWRPITFCPMSGRTFAQLLWIALSTLVFGVSSSNFAIISAAIVAFAVVGAALALWRFWCAPSYCIRVGAMCWAFKRAFILGLPLAAFYLSPAGALLTFGYGTIAGIQVVLLRERRCDVPGASTPLNQLPFW